MIKRTYHCYYQCYPNKENNEFIGANLTIVTNSIFPKDADFIKKSISKTINEEHKKILTDDSATVIVSLTRIS